MSSGPTNRIVFFGTEEFSAISLQALIDNGFNVAAVVTKPDSKKGRGQKLVPPTVKLIAQKHSIPVWQPNRLSEVIENIRQLQPVSGVLVSFGKLIPSSIIDLFSPGIINVHPSKLPTYRGPSPIESAILNGDSQTGVSIMQLVAKMDAGPIYSFVQFELNGTETQAELYTSLGQAGASELVNVLPRIIDGTLQATPQDESAASYCQLIQKADGIINWTQPAAKIERQIRALKSWPGSRTTISGTEIIITKAHVSDSAGDPKRELSFECGDKKYLYVDTLKPVGKKEMPVQAFLAGHKIN